MPVACKPFQERTLLWQRVFDAVAGGALGDDGPAFLGWMVEFEIEDKPLRPDRDKVKRLRHEIAADRVDDNHEYDRRGAGRLQQRRQRVGAANRRPRPGFRRGLYFYGARSPAQAHSQSSVLKGDYQNLAGVSVVVKVSYSRIQ